MVTPKDLWSIIIYDDAGRRVGGARERGWGVCVGEGDETGQCRTTYTANAQLPLQSQYSLQLSDIQLSSIHLRSIQSPRTHSAVVLQPSYTTTPSRLTCPLFNPSSLDRCAACTKPTAPSMHPAMAQCMTFKPLFPTHDENGVCCRWGAAAHAGHHRWRMWGATGKET